MSGWYDSLLESLTERDNTEQELLPYFEAFLTASRRAADSKPAPPGTDIGESQQDVIDKLNQSRARLAAQLRISQRQLELAQERARKVAEEQYMKTHAVEALHDEILALTMQLNLSEERRKKLQDELGR